MHLEPVNLNIWDWKSTSMNFYTAFAVFFNRIGPNGKGVAIINIQYLGQSLRVQLVRADSEIDVLFSILKASSIFSISSGHKTTYKNPGSNSLPYSLPSLWKICKVILPTLAPLLIRLRDNIHTSAPTCAWIRADWRNVFEKWKNCPLSWMRADPKTYAVRSRLWLLLENSSVLGVSWPRRRLQANQGTVRKSTIFPEPGNRIRFKWSIRKQS